MLKKYLPLIFAFIGGLFYATGFPMFSNFSFIFGPILGFYLINYSLNYAHSKKLKILYSWAYGLGFYILGFYWIPFLMQEFGGFPFPVNHIMGAMFTLIILPQILIYAFFKKYFKTPIGLAIFYSLLEYYTPQQFPAHIGHTFISLAPQFNLNLAPLFGSPIFSFIVALIAILALKGKKSFSQNIFEWTLVSVLLIFNFLPFSFNFSANQITNLNIRMVQPNIGNFLKIGSEKGDLSSIKDVYQRYFELSTRPSTNPIDLIIWPETAFPSLLSSDLMKKTQEIPILFKEIINKTNAELFIGGYDYKPLSQSNDGFKNEYNAAFYFSKESKFVDVYRKMKLIPFGEGLPFGPFNQFLSQYIKNVSFFADGESPTHFIMPNKSTFTSAICYEILFPRLMRNIMNHQTQKPSFIINLTNDSWYGDTSEPYQHLFLSKWRAVEFQIPIIRSTNTGITTVIYPDGSESINLGINQQDSIDLPVKINQSYATIYQRFGINVFLIFIIALILAKKTLLSKGHVNE